jgi:23S rRNA pseudouridine2605 synthase
MSERKPYRGPKKQRSFSKGPSKKGLREESPELLRLNKFISNAGVCSRRDADALIANGEIKLNGKVVTELGLKVSLHDKVEYDGKTLNPETLRYVLLNKPKDHVTTTRDEKGRKTVMHLIRKACTERIYPVGRLDRNTTGLLLFTNDGELAKHLTHPSHGADKLYHVVLDRSVTKEHLQELVEGVELEDGVAKADEASFVGRKRTEIGLRIHMGKNRIVRRMMEHLGYRVVKLDRVMFAGLTKKELERGYWRHLTEKEVGFLKRIR